VTGQFHRHALRDARANHVTDGRATKIVRNTPRTSRLDARDPSAHLPKHGRLMANEYNEEYDVPRKESWAMPHSTTRGTTKWTLMIATVTLLTGTVWAHHGWTGYEEKEQTVTGTIRESSYENPHGSIRLQADGTNGKTWLVVLAPTGRMTDRGLTRDALKVGTRATVVGYAHKTTQDEMRAERITMAGKTTELR
jgi:Family of unknown function (DUF6152)